MTLREFAVRVRELLRLPPLDDDDLNPYDSLYDDWGLDSIKAFELIIVVESLAGCLVPPERVPELYTIADAYEYFEMCRQLGAEL